MCLAKELKGEILKENAQFVISNYVKAFEVIPSAVEDRLKKREICMQDDLASLDEMREGIKTPKQLMDCILTDDRIKELVNRAATTMKEAKDDGKVLHDFVTEVNILINDIACNETREVNEKYIKWKRDLKSSCLRSLNYKELLSGYNFLPFVVTELPKSLPENAVTSNVLWGIATGCAAGIVIGSALPVVSAGAGRYRKLNERECIFVSDL